MTYHVVEPRWTELTHHRLRKGILWRLEQTEHGVVALASISKMRRDAPRLSHPNFQAVWNPDNILSCIQTKRKCEHDSPKRVGPYADHTPE